MAEARTRIRRVRFKSGGEVVLLHTEPSPTRSTIEGMFRDVLDKHPDATGFAMVVWDADTASTSAQWHAKADVIPAALVPDFVRNRLLLGTAVNWSLQDVNAAWGLPSDDPEAS